MSNIFIIKSSDELYTKYSLTEVLLQEHCAF